MIMTHINGAKVIDPMGQLSESDTLAWEGEHFINTPSKNSEGICGDGKWLFPGIVDLSAYLRSPNLEHKAKLDTELESAAAGGITTICMMPEAQNQLDSPAHVNLIKARADTINLARVCFIGNLTSKLEGKQLSNMGALKHAQCVAVSNGLRPIKNLSVLRHAMEYAANFDLTVFICPIESQLSKGGFMHEGSISTRIGMPGIPVAAETAALAQCLSLMTLTGAKVHIARISSASGVELIRQAKKQGLNITADVAAHHLHLTDQDVVDFNPLCHVIPPLRSERDREGLLQGLADDTIDAICSDHRPHELDAKLTPFQQSEPGISGLETLLPLTLRLVENGVMPLMQAISKITRAPAEIIGLPVGSFATGHSADAVLFDPNAWFDCERLAFKSAGKNSPFDGWSFSGRVDQTFYQGRQVYTAAS